MCVLLTWFRKKTDHLALSKIETKQSGSSRYHSTSQDQKCPVHLVVRITAPPAFCYLPYFIRLSQKELQDQFKESFCCLAPSGSSLDRNNPFTSSLQRLSKVLNSVLLYRSPFLLSSPKSERRPPAVNQNTKLKKRLPGNSRKPFLCRSYCGGMEDVAYATRRSRCRYLDTFFFIV